MARVVLDSSAVLAVLNDEPGAGTVIAVLDDAVVSTVNLAEVVTKLVERGGSLDHARRALRAIDVDVADFDQALAERTGGLKVETERRGLSLGDRACLALAEREGVPALTGDRSWLGAVAGIDIQLIR
jgi:PIN domain nuclease of toxin-antitoxin system